MATVVVKGCPEQTLEGQAAIEFLRARGIDYQRWDVEGVPAHLRVFGKMSEEDQRALLSLWGEQLEALMKANGYQTADVIAVSEETTPNLDQMLDRFRPEHYHTEDEVRFVVGGSGVFGIHQESPEDIVFEVHVGPGDLLSVPRGTWHWFDLKEDRRIQCVRLFQDPSGWTPHYRTEKATAG
ncbi:MAG TPA: cupin domain-containing protein [Candidatus Nitrosotenuis sp.]|jgi:1,2-dihydroxy-3-keto-5-methylthiopentene dioxygenase|nr:cupin domain-containing protein [Candidatus Nitrosotenuis sp.]